MDLKVGICKVGMEANLSERFSNSIDPYSIDWSSIQFYGGDTQLRVINMYFRL